MLSGISIQLGFSNGRGRWSEHWVETFDNSFGHCLREPDNPPSTSCRLPQSKWTQQYKWQSSWTVSWHFDKMLINSLFFVFVILDNYFSFIALNHGPLKFKLPRSMIKFKEFICFSRVIHNIKGHNKSWIHVTDPMFWWTGPLACLSLFSFSVW